MCGETCTANRAEPLLRGPSPCAGKPPLARSPTAASGVHPRVCGETLTDVRQPDPLRGPSPRVRGNPCSPCSPSSTPRSIPACAGKPGAPDEVHRMLEVHPRVCGETFSSARRPIAASGPSPRVRGNRRAPSSSAVLPGSIPACAGKPTGQCTSLVSGRVHPRVCGETAVLSRPSGGLKGPSPRVRGNRQSRPRTIPISRSIPACAGKPAGGDSGRLHVRVHPRVCGETPTPSLDTHLTEGPSPRVRGNLCHAFGHEDMDGSIPACAGKPPSHPPTFSWDEVHPRVCGETRRRPISGSRARGPSPRVRGNRSYTPDVVYQVGSIPACAGKPIA